MGPHKKEFVAISSALIAAYASFNLDDKTVAKRSVARARALAEELGIPEDPYEKEREEEDRVARAHAASKVGP